MALTVARGLAGPTPSSKRGPEAARRGAKTGGTAWPPHFPARLYPPIFPVSEFFQAVSFRASAL